MADIIVALFKEGTEAEAARTDLVRMGFATDRVDVSSKAVPGRALHAPLDGGGSRFHGFFKTLLANSTIADEAESLADQVDQGSTALLIHPRGRVELHEVNEVLERHPAEVVKRDCRQSIAPTPVVGEHAAGKR